MLQQGNRIPFLLKTRYLSYFLISMTKHHDQSILLQSLLGTLQFEEELCPPCWEEWQQASRHGAGAAAGLLCPGT